VPPASEGWVDWRTRHVPGGATAGTDPSVCRYAGDGTIDPSVLGGGGNSPDTFEDHPSSPVRRLNRDDGALSRTTDEGAWTTRKRKRNTSWVCCLSTRTTTTLSRDWARARQGQRPSGRCGRRRQIAGLRQPCRRCWCEDPENSRRALADEAEVEH
jgi:hypothetical protein